MAEEPVETLNAVLEYLTGIVLPTSQGQRNYKVHENAMRLCYALTLSLTSIRCLERLFHDTLLLNFMCEMGIQKNQKGFFERVFADNGSRKPAIAATEALFTLWTDLTMVYQAEFPAMWEAFCKFKLKKTSNVVLARLTGSKPVENHDFDGLRLIMHNFERQFVDVPVLSV